MGSSTLKAPAETGGKLSPHIDSYVKKREK
jgi:hypothetical protein